MSFSIQTYISLAAILISLVVIFFGMRRYSKFVDNENFIFEKYGGILGNAILAAAMVAIPLVVIIAASMFLTQSLGVSISSHQELSKSMLWPFSFLTLALFIMCILSALKTRRLAKNGHKLAGYLCYMINPRFNLLKLIYAFFLAMVLLTVCFWVGTTPDSTGPVTVQGRIEGITGVVIFIAYCALVGYTNRILHFVMKKLLGKDLNLDYTSLVARAKREFGVSEEDFYNKNFTPKELKWLEKDKEENGNS